jgi:hypothetical protein
MTAQFTKLPWRKPKVRVLDWPAFHLPFNNYIIIIKDGREYTFRSIPTVLRTTYKFDPPALLAAITVYFGERKTFFADEVKRRAKLEDENGPLQFALRGEDPTAKSLGGFFSEIENKNFHGLCIKRFEKRRDREAGFRWWVIPHC